MPTAPARTLRPVWTLAALEQAEGHSTDDEEGYRREIVDGQLLVTPPPSVEHQILADALCRLWRRGATADGTGAVAVTGVGIHVTATAHRDECVLVPDVVLLLARPEPGQGVVRADQVEAVAEVLSRSTARRDRTLKASLYAELGIRTYLLVDPVAQSVEVLRRSGGAYVEVPGLSWQELAAEAHP